MQGNVLDGRCNTPVAYGERFAAGVSRDVIRSGAEMLGWELDELFARTIAAMQSFAPDRDTFVPAE